MLDPTVAIHDLDGCGFELLNELLARRDLSTDPHVQVVHEHGLVLSALHSSRGVLPGPYPADAAGYWRTVTGAERVVLVDLDALSGLLDLEHDLAAPEHSQTELLTGLTAAFWASDAVYADPPVTPGSWPALAARLRQLADVTLLLVADRDGTPALRLAGRFSRGRLVELTGFPRQRLAQLAGAPDTLLVRLSWTELEQLLLAPDFPAAALQYLTPQVDPPRRR
jgi:hypothetical protein